MSSKRFEHVINALVELNEDSSVPKNVQDKVAKSIKILNDEKLGLPIQKSKVLAELEELSDDVNLQTDIRTQLFNVFGLLEAV
ncbi:MAG: UPF0147 family protein [Nanoarchaeota archaeon]